ncbi:alpha/beta hydrolase [Rothia nasimurium]|uniref:alpha/beta hydrolase n=1 Tax=Rothia nasimurium TaxID=85336 RepID=UPI001F45E6E9|nr:alpha/beta hydrolase [Rothia nasimurium]
MSTRPSDWSPLTGGDPCPGDPSAWDAIVEFWAQRSRDIDGYREKLYQHTSIDAEGKTFGRLEGTFSDGAGMASLISYEFEKASDAARSWQHKLEDMQSRADEALRKAKAAKTAKDDAQIKADGLRAEAAKDKSPDPIIAVKLHGLFGGGGLEGEIADAQADIEAAQKVVDDIRDEYARESVSAIGGYELASVQGIYESSPRGNPFGKPINVVDSLGIETTEYIALLESQASQSPTALGKYLDALGNLDPDDLNEYFVTHPNAAKYPLEVSGETVNNAVVVKDWWASLNKDQRAVLMDAAPGMIGNLNGVSYGDRDKANRWLGQKISADPNTDSDTLALLESLRKAATSKSGEPKRYITSLDLSNLKKENEDGYGYNNVLASVSLGSLDDADKVSIVVPGMTNNVSSMEDLVTSGLNIYREQKFAVRDHGDGSQQVAVNLWIGYESPPDLEAQAQHPDKLVTDVNLARKGGQKLADYIDGLNVTKSASPANSQMCFAPNNFNDPFISVIAHSYGTTTVGEAMKVAETNVNNAVLYGSAGIGVDSVADSNWGDGWKVDRDQKGKQQIFYTDSLEDWTAPGGYVPGWLPFVGPVVSGEPRVTPELMIDAQRFQSTEGISADGHYYEDVDTHSFESKPGEQGFVHADTTSLTYGARASMGYSEDLQKKFYQPWYFEQDFRGEPVLRRVTADDLVDGKVPTDLMQKIKSSQDIAQSDLINVESK